MKNIRTLDGKELINGLYLRRPNGRVLYKLVNFGPGTMYSKKGYLGLETINSKGNTSFMIRELVEEGVIDMISATQEEIIIHNI